MNFTYVRICSIALAMLVAAAGAPAAGAAEPREPARAEAPPRAIVAVMPSTFWPPVLRDVPGVSPGVMSTGVGVTPATQTYLDIAQGNRVADALYDEPLPNVAPRGGRVPPGEWRKAAERAADAPAELVPGLLATALERSGVPTRVERGMGLPALIGTGERGRIRLAPPGGCGVRGCGPGLSLLRAVPGRLPRMIAALRGWDLLIALRELPAYRVNLVTIAVAGAGFDGNLTSDSTRTRGIVLSSDIAPTVLERFGVAVPEEMNGHPIRAEGRADVGAVESLEDRLTARPSRTLVVLVPLEVWLALTALAALLFRARGARRALPLLALSCVWGPAMLLLGAAIRPGETVEALIFGIGAPALAALALAALPAYAALALSCAVVVGAHAVDVIAGSPLTSLSVLGPNPGGGVRFFGIGNELEATLTALTLIGAGAGLAALRLESRRGVAAAFLAGAIAAALAFAPGRFGADVGAAIVLGAGGAVAAALALRLDRRWVALGAVAVPALALGALVALDLALGGAHLTGSVLGADSSGELSDVLERRLRLTARSFTHPAYPELLAIAAALLALGAWQRRRVLAWFGDRWQARCGYLGALAGVLVGTAANDSGTLLLTIGTIYLAVCAGFFWGTTRDSSIGPVV